MRLDACVAVLLLAAGAAALRAQDPASSEPETIFRSGVTVGQIDVLVTGPDGKPVAGLTPGDFELREDGLPRTITTFRAVALPTNAGDLAPVQPDDPDAADVSSNTPSAGRVYVFALDAVAPCDALRARHLLRQFVDEHLGPDDVASVALIGPGLATDGQDFTRNRGLLLAAIDKFSGSFARGCERRYTPPGTLRSGRSQQMANLRALMESLALIPGRKAVILFTQSLEVDIIDVVDYRSGLLGLAGEDARAMLRAATRGNVSIYPIDPAGLTGEYTPLATTASFSALARATGGTALINSNSLPELFERIVRENSVYYTLGFNSAIEQETGRFVDVEVTVTRPGLTVRAPQGYLAPTRKEVRADQALREASAAARAIATPLSTGGVSMRVSAMPFRGTGNRVVVHAVTEIEVASLDLEKRDGRLAGTLEFRQVVTTEREKSFPESRAVAELDLPGGDAHGVVRIVSAIALPPGRHQLRVAAGTATTAGSVVYDLEIPRFGDGPYAMGGVLLTTRAAREVPTFVLGSPADTLKARRCRPPACKDKDAAVVRLTEWGLAPGGAVVASARTSSLERWPYDATTAREFASDGVVAVYTEVYDNRRSRRDAAPAPLVLVAELLDDAGKVVRRVEDASTSDDSQPARTISVPLGGLTAGTYDLRLSLSPESGDDAPQMRVLPITVVEAGE